ncbi:DoxX family protein [Actinophytocola glycyrrhizae]|uniref:DoxX family protein n=1 Tax=Actinophytocola glycyrrhizae TaxID=2044873 RepID=A0ABV9S1C6_9PSEU
MSTAHVVVSLVAAAMVGFSAGSVLLHAKWVVGPLADYGVPRSWWPWLGAAKAAGAAGLAAGVFVPVLGVVAGICLVLYFACAMITVLRARFWAHVSAPVLYVAPVVASLVLT